MPENPNEMFDHLRSEVYNEQGYDACWLDGI